MPRIACFQVSGVDLRFHSHDHRPAHFHAKATGQWEIRVFFLREPPVYEIVWQVSRIPSPRLREILEGAAEHRATLLEEWSAGVLPDE